MIHQDKIRALQDILQTTMGANFDLPRVVVLGSQSSGKSSVLEQILRKDFLPRGNNLVTRCPIIISLKKSEQEGCKIDGIDIPFNDIPESLVEKMARNCGSEKGIVDKPINLQLSMKNTLDMVLIDLPGLTKIPIGDQPADIENQILRMAKKYIAGDNTLILCTIAANADIATSESLKIAKDVDPLYERTIGVLTKIDLMDEGTDCTEVLNNTYPKLRYGYIGVINRSQYDINRGLSIDAAIEKEENWFKTHEPYIKYENKIGSKYLLSKLCDIFQNIFDRELPRIKISLRNTFEELKREKESLQGENKTKKILIEYANTIGSFIGYNRESTFVSNRSNLVALWCNEIHSHSIHISIDDLDKFIGEEEYLFLPEKPFEEKIRDSTKKITTELLSVSSKGFSAILSSIESIKHQEYQSLTMYLNEYTVGRLKSQYQSFKNELNRQNAIQNGYINLLHPNFDKNSIIANKIYERIKSLNGTWGKDHNETQVFDYNFVKELIGALIYEYTNIFTRDMKDITIKLIQSQIGQFIKNRLIPEIISMDNNPQLYAESKEEKKLKEELNRDIESLKSALIRLGLDIEEYSQ